MTRKWAQHLIIALDRPKIETHFFLRMYNARTVVFEISARNSLSLIFFNKIKLFGSFFSRLVQKNYRENSKNARATFVTGIRLYEVRTQSSAKRKETNDFVRFARHILKQWFPTQLKTVEHFYKLSVLPRTTARYNPLIYMYYM